TRRSAALVVALAALLLIGLSAGIWYWATTLRPGANPPPSTEVEGEPSPAEGGNASSSLVRTLTWHSGMVNSIAFSADGTVLASGSDDKTARLWNTKTGAVRQIITGHNGVVSSVALTSDGLLLATGSQDKTIKLWNAQTGSLIRTFSGHSRKVF